MWPYSPFAQPVSSFERPVPLIFVDPCDRPDVRIEFRHEWLPYVLGALKQLLLQTTWKTDSPQEFYEMQGRVANLLSCFALAGDVQDCPVPIEEMAYDMSICEQLRYNPATHKFEGLCCGVWEPIPGQAGVQIGGPTQEGSGAPQPAPGGGCQVYHAVFDANGQYLLPTVVNSGDVLSFSNSGGAATNGDISGLWYCPNGQTFFAGQCIGFPGNKVGDETTAVGTMAIIANINGVWYKAFEGTITVPGGVSNAQVYLQANDSPLDDNKGSYSVDVEVCNNSVGTWSHTIDFALNDGGFVVYSANPTELLGQWVAGTGWTWTEGVNGSSVARRGLILQKTLTIPAITRVSLLCSFTKGVYDAAETAQEIASNTTAWVSRLDSAAVEGANVIIDSGVLAPASITDTFIRLITDRQASTVVGFTGNTVAKSITYYGNGANPFA